MIFVTVGTHEQQFNRLIECIDNLKAQGKIEDKIVMQTGFSTYEPKNCEWSKLYSYDEMQKNIDEARIVITHGGPSSFVAPLQVGKIPIVVPRKYSFDEHINDHQLDFCREVEKRNKNIILVEDIENMEEIIVNYDSIVAKMTIGVKSNNQRFCDELEKLFI